jgi:hypothetical protein
VEIDQLQGVMNLVQGIMGQDWKISIFRASYPPVIKVSAKGQCLL